MDFQEEISQIVKQYQVVREEFDCLKELNDTASERLKMTEPKNNEILERKISKIENQEKAKNEVMSKVKRIEEQCSIENYLKGDNSLLEYLSEADKNEKIQKLNFLKNSLKKDMETLEGELKCAKGSLHDVEKKKAFQDSHNLKYQNLQKSIEISKKNCEALEAKIAQLSYINRTRRNNHHGNNSRSKSIPKNDPKMLHSNNKIGFDNLRNRYTKSIKKNTRDLELIKAKQQGIEKLESEYSYLKQRMQKVREENRKLEKVVEQKMEIPKFKEIERKESYFLREKATNLKRRCEQKGLLPKTGQDPEEFVNLEGSKNNTPRAILSSKQRSLNDELTDFKIEEAEVEKENPDEEDIEEEMRSISVMPLTLDNPGASQKEASLKKDITMTPIVK